MDEKEQRFRERLMFELADAVAEVSDAEIIDEAEEAEVDIALRTAHVRHVLMDGMKQFQQSALREAMIEYQRQVKHYRDRAFQLPK